jgi:hypothetical protein
VLLTLGTTSVEFKLTFCTLMLWLVLLKIKLALIAFANRRAYDIQAISIH